MPPARKNEPAIPMYRNRPSPLQRLDGLLLEVVDRELEGVVPGMAQPAGAVV